MLEFIKNIPGPLFLFYFLIYSACIYLLYRFLIKIIDNSESSDSWKHISLNSLDVAVLNHLNKITEIIKSTIVSLWQKKLLDFNTDGTLYMVKGNEKEQVNEMERDVLKYFVKPALPGTAIKSKELAKTISRHVEKVTRKLTEGNYLHNSDATFKNRFIYLFSFFLVLMPGFIKMFLGISNNKPVTFLVFELILIFIIYLLSKPSKISLRGKNYLKQLKIEYNWVKNQGTTRKIQNNAINNDTETNSNNSTGYNPSSQQSGIGDAVLIAALFGVGALAVFPEHEALANYMPHINGATTSGCSSCSASTGGCSSSSGCSSGSGCSGGSGCGGCGGGGD